MAKSIINDLLQIFKVSISAVLPENLIRRSLKYNQTNQQLTVVGENYNLQNKNIYLIGAGKAVQNMAKEVEKILDSHIKYGIISIPEGSLITETKHKSVLYFEGAKNNLPDRNAEETTRKVENLVKNLGNDDLLLVLISGGGSALLSLPKTPITLDEKTDLIKKLANSGADIKELNAVRKRLSGVKGGQLAIKAQPAKVISLILSDIVGDPIDLIASGPTVENKDDHNKAINIVKKYDLYATIPDSIKTILEENKLTEKFPTDNVRNHVIGSNKLSIAAAVNKAKELNYLPIALSNSVTGNVKDVAKEYIELVKIFRDYITGKLEKDSLKSRIEALHISGISIDFKDDLMKNKDICLILGGETTVEVKGNGKGGRNQQLALEFSKKLNELKDGFKNLDVYFLSAGTDGIDGPTDAAGGIGYLNLISDCEKEHLDVHKYLKNNDSYNFYKVFKNGELHVITGHTNTNVMDINLIIIQKT